MDNTTGHPLAYTVPEFCKAVGISRTRLFEMLRTGEGPRVKRAGKRLLIPVDEAQRWLKSLPDRDPGAAA